MELKTARGRLFILLLILLVTPLLAGRFHFLKEWDLRGDIRNTPKPLFSWRSWWNGTYQDSMNDHLNDSVAGRTWLVRINNQIDYSLFGKLHAREVIMEKNHCLYEQAYIDAYHGRDFKGDDEVRQRLTKLKFIQDTLDRLGTKLILVYAPSKARFYPEYIPDNLRSAVPPGNYYDAFLRIGDSLHIRQVNLNGWFAAIKDKYRGKQLLMSKQGIHWTVFGAMIGTDSLQRFMEKELHIDMPDVSWKINEHSYTTDARDADNDLFKGLNILFPVTSEKFCYPEISVKDDSTKQKPKAIYIADSFFWVVLFNKIIQQTHSDWQFWYYFHEVWGSNVKDGAMVREMDWPAIMAKNDCVVILYTEQNLRALGSGFIEDAYNHFKPHSPAK